MAVCIIGSLLNICEVCCSLNLVLVNRSIILVVDAVTVFRDYIVITCSAFCFTGKDYSCFIANNFYTADHWSIRFFIFCFAISLYCLRTCIVLRFAFSGYSICTIIVVFSCVLCSRNWKISIKNCYNTIFNSYCTIVKILLINTPI